MIPAERFFTTFLLVSGTKVRISTPSFSFYGNLLPNVQSIFEKFSSLVNLLNLVNLLTTYKTLISKKVQLCQINEEEIGMRVILNEFVN